MDMKTHLALHVVFHVAAMGLMVIPGMAVAGVALTPGNIFLGATDMTLSAVEGMTMLGDVGMSAPGTDYVFGMMDHGAGAHGGEGLANAFSGHAHGGGDVMADAGSAVDPHAGHEAACSIEDMGSAFDQWLDGQSAAGNLPAIDGEIANNPDLSSRWDSFAATFCPPEMS